MKIFGLIGYPLTNSFSEEYFTQKFQALGLSDHVYRNFPLSRVEDFPKLLVTEEEMSGLNVTIPYKESIIPYLGSLSAEAEAIGAVNTISFGSAGLLGQNTDWIGFKASLEPLLSHWDKTPSALILGTGGASKAVAYALTTLRIPYVMISRNRTSLGLTYDELKDDLVSRSLLIINTTPLGTYPMTGEAPEISYDSIGAGHLLYDLTYNPAQSTFLRKGQERGAGTKNGLEMLQIQAEASWVLWQQNQMGHTF